MGEEQRRVRVEDIRVLVEDILVRVEDSRVLVEDNLVQVVDSLFRVVGSLVRVEDSLVRVEDSRVRVNDRRAAGRIRRSSQRHHWAPLAGKMAGDGADSTAWRRGITITLARLHANVSYISATPKNQLHLLNVPYKHVFFYFYLFVSRTQREEEDFPQTFPYKENIMER